jgi:hypothetical protein
MAELVTELQSHALVRAMGAAAVTDVVAAFLPRFICRTCGPTNRVVGGSEGFICVVCQQAAAYQIMTDCGIILV